MYVCMYVSMFVFMYICALPSSTYFPHPYGITYHTIQFFLTLNPHLILLILTHSNPTHYITVTTPIIHEAYNSPLTYKVVVRIKKHQPQLHSPQGASLTTHCTLHTPHPLHPPYYSLPCHCIPL